MCENRYEIYNDNNIFSIDDARFLINIKQTLRSTAYPNERQYIQDTIRAFCGDINEITFSEKHEESVIVITPKNKKVHINEDNIHSVIYNIIKDIYQRYVVNVYGKTNNIGTLDVSRLYHIVNLGEELKIYL